MKKIFALLLFFAASASAQEATLTVPVVPPSEAKHTVRQFTASAGYIAVDIDVKTSGNVVVRTYRIELPDVAHPAATVNAAWTQLQTAIAGENGTSQKVALARLTKFLNDQGYFPAATVNP